MIKKKHFFHLIFIFALALVSQYQIQNLSDINWDIALFLTPWGIVENWSSRDSHVLWQFYFDQAQPQTQLSTSQFILMISIYLCLLLSAKNIIKDE